MRVGYYETGTGRSAPRDFIDRIAEPFRGSDTVAEHGAKAPVSMKPVTGRSPMWEIRTGGYRIFYYFAEDMVVVLHVCKKQDQRRGIEIAGKRMNELREV